MLLYGGTLMRAQSAGGNGHKMVQVHFEFA